MEGRGGRSGEVQPKAQVCPFFFKAFPYIFDFLFLNKAFLRRNIPVSGPGYKKAKNYFQVRYRPDFDQTLDIGFLDPLEHISTVTMTFVREPFVLVTFVHIKDIATLGSILDSQLS